MPIPFIILGVVSFAGGCTLAKRDEDNKAHRQAVVINYRADNEYSTARDNVLSAYSALMQGLEHLGKLKVIAAQEAISYMVNVVVMRINQGNLREKPIFNQYFTVDDFKECNVMLKVLSPRIDDRTFFNFAASGSPGLFGYDDVFFVENYINELPSSIPNNNSSYDDGFLRCLSPDYLMNHEAQQELTQAYENRDNYKNYTMIFDGIKYQIHSILEAKNELYDVIESLNNDFNQVKVGSDASNADFARMLKVGKTLKDAINAPVMTQDWQAVSFKIS